jgi:L-alanine-DL-glutamate epimerase-like enolase superfamily enzyme
MKISHIETFTNEFVCFVKVTTDTGDIGWGQVAPYYADITAQIVHRQVAPYALGQSAIDIDYLVDLIPRRSTSSPAPTSSARSAASTRRSGTCVAGSRASRSAS